MEMEISHVGIPTSNKLFRRHMTQIDISRICEKTKLRLQFEGRETLRLEGTQFDFASKLSVEVVSFGMSNSSRLELRLTIAEAMWPRYL